MLPLRRTHRSELGWDLDEEAEIEARQNALCVLSHHCTLHRQLAREPHVFAVRWQGREVIAKVLPFAGEHHCDVPLEVRTLRAAGRHPHVAELLTWFRLSPEMYATLYPRYPESDLEHVWTDLDTIRTYMRQILGALEHLRARNVFYRDLKPSNVLWDRDARCARLIDFDVATFHPEAPHLRACGTREFLAPERRRHPSPYDYKSEVFSAGVVLGMLLHQIHEGQITRHHVAKWEQLNRRKGNSARAQAYRLMRSMLTRNPAQRPSFVECLAHPFLAEAPVAALSATDDPPVAPP